MLKRTKRYNGSYKKQKNIIYKRNYKLKSGIGLYKGEGWSKNGIETTKETRGAHGRKSLMSQCSLMRLTKQRGSDTQWKNGMEVSCVEAEDEDVASGSAVKNCLDR